MKNTFAKKVLLLGAVAVGLSAVVPAQAMMKDQTRFTGFRERVSNAFSGLSKQELEKRLHENMTKLNQHFRSFMACVKRDKPCTGAQKAVIVTTLGTIMAIVAALSIYGGKKLGQAEAAKIIAANKLNTTTGERILTRTEKAKLYAAEPAYAIEKGVAKARKAYSARQARLAAEKAQREAKIAAEREKTMSFKL